MAKHGDPTNPHPNNPEHKQPRTQAPVDTTQAPMDERGERGTWEAVSEGVAGAHVLGEAEVAADDVLEEAHGGVLGQPQHHRAAHRVLVSLVPRTPCSPQRRVPAAHRSPAEHIAVALCSRRVYVCVCVLHMAKPGLEHRVNV
eukprot:3708746-Rhodomonas_salina.6